MWFNEYYQYEMKTTELNVLPLPPSVAFFYVHVITMVIPFP